MASLPIQSWTGSTYQKGSVDEVIGPLIQWAVGKWILRRANASNSNAAVNQPYYQPLKSCPGASTPCPQEAILSALNALRVLLPTCIACKSKSSQSCTEKRTRTKSGTNSSSICRGHPVSGTERSHTFRLRTGCALLDSSSTALWPQVCPSTNTLGPVKLSRKPRATRERGCRSSSNPQKVSATFFHCPIQALGTEVF